MVLVYIMLALVAGALVPFQAGINATLRTYLGNPVSAALVSFSVGTLTLLAIVLATRQQVPPMSVIREAPWWVWFGGFIGAFFVTSSIIAAPRLGAMALVALILAGQMVTSLVLDQFGLIGYPVHPISGLRILGGVFVIIGAVLIQRF